MSERVGEVVWITGPVVVAKGVPRIELGEIVEVGNEGLIGEVIRIKEDEFTIQVYEPTSGLRPGEPVKATGKKLVAELGPGLLGSIVDGIERPLDKIIELVKSPFITRGVKVNTLPREKKWHFKPVVKPGEKVGPGDILGEVQETPYLLHKIMVPPGLRGEVVEAEEGDYTVEDDVVLLRFDGKEVGVKMLQEWPVRVPRPIASDGRLPPTEPLFTGQRVIDVLFPIAKGGAGCIPGGFGTGKTVTLHQLAKWSDADVVVYIGCGERGNEMCEVLTEFPHLKDPRTGRPLMERTVLIANTSNMPVSAREASIYMGITVAEYYRDMGYHVALMADSTSRWAEALREISGRLEEMPVEQGYPAYLPDKIAEFYERAGRVKCLGRPERVGSVTIVGAVSPPGGDFNEPVTIHTLRFTGIFWALDKDLAYSRHFPAIHWLRSYSLYADQIAKWWVKEHPEYPELRRKAMEILTVSSEIEQIARIIGEAALPDDQRLILLAAELIKEAFLQQSAFHEVDSYCPPEKQVAILKMIIDFYERAMEMVKRKDSPVPAAKIRELRCITEMKRAKEKPTVEEVQAIARRAIEELEALEMGYVQA